MTKTPLTHPQPSTKPLSYILVGFACVAATLFCLNCGLALGVKTASKAKAKGPSAAHLYRLSLKSNERYIFAARQFVTTWRDDGTVYATVAQVYHFAPNLDKITYTAPRSRVGVTIIEDDGSHQEWTYLPQRNIIVHALTSPDLKPDPNSELTLVQQNYRFAVSSKPVLIAGRKAYVLQLVRRRPGRPYEDLWIDPYTGIILRREKFSSDGSLVSVTYLDQVTFHTDLTPSDFTTQAWAVKSPKTIEKASRPEEAVDFAHLPAPFAGSVKVVQSLDGYGFIAASMLHRPKEDSLHLLYSDGLYPVSIYATPRHTTRATKMIGSRQLVLAPHEIARALQRYSYWLVNWDTPGMTYTVAGEASLPAMLQVARLQYQTTVPPAPPHHATVIGR